MSNFIPTFSTLLWHSDVMEIEETIVKQGVKDDSYEQLGNS